MKKIAIHSVPRSGSTWLGALFDSHPQIKYKFQPLFSYEFKGALNENSSEDEINFFFKKIAAYDSEFLDQTLEKKKGISPNFKKEEIKGILYKEVRYHHILENLLKKVKDLKVIGLIRDPRATLYSWWQAPREFKINEWNFNEEWYTASKKNEVKIENYYGYQKWKEAALLFLKLEKIYPGQFKVINYRNLLHNTEEVIKQLMYFCDFKLHQQQIDFITESQKNHNLDAYSVYKIKRDDRRWEGKLPLSVIDFIERDLQNTELEQYIE